MKGVFIDAWSQQPWNLADGRQQEAFGRETNKLWTFMEENELFEFRTVDDVLEENQQLKEENKWLNDIITNNITELRSILEAQAHTHAIDIAQVIIRILFRYTRCFSPSDFSLQTIGSKVANSYRIPVCQLRMDQ